LRTWRTTGVGVVKNNMSNAPVQNR
jgi:hypothetical protein